MREDDCSFVELAQAEVASDQAEATYAEAGYAYNEAEAELRHAAGRTLRTQP